MRRYLLIALIIGAVGGITTAADYTYVAGYNAITGVVNTTRCDTFPIGVGKTGTYLRTNPDVWDIEFGYTAATTTADSGSYVVIKAYRRGKVWNIGADSVMIKPAVPARTGRWVGNVRAVWCEGDSVVAWTTWKDGTTNGRLAIWKRNTP